jgi:hypothetical protein
MQISEKHSHHPIMEKFHQLKAPADILIQEALFHLLRFQTNHLQHNMEITQLEEVETQPIIPAQVEFQAVVQVMENKIKLVDFQVVENLAGGYTRGAYGSTGTNLQGGLSSSGVSYSSTSGVGSSGSGSGVTGGSASYSSTLGGAQGQSGYSRTYGTGSSVTGSSSGTSGTSGVSGSQGSSTSYTRYQSK